MPAAVLVVAVVLGVALRPTSRAALVIVLAAACGVALAAAWTIVRARREDPTSAAADLREGRVAALLLLALVLPAAIDLLPDAVADVRDPPAAERTLPPGLVAALRRLPDRAVVAADVETAYLVPAVSVALIYAGPPAHVANSRENDPYGRRAELNLMLSPRTAPERRRALLAEHEIGYVLLDRRLRSFSSLARRLPVEGGYRVRYRDGRYTLYAVGR